MVVRTTVSRSTTFNPATRITDFLGSGYTTKCVTQASLNDLLSIYPSLSLFCLVNAKNNLTQIQQAGYKKGVPWKITFLVFMFKKINNNLPQGLTTDSFAEFFSTF